MIRFIRITFLSLSLLLVSTTTQSVGDIPYQLKTIVIDAGHGGHDNGCSGAGSHEKHVALDIALKLGSYIEQNFPDTKVIYTRKKDVFIELHERARIANRNKADLFISIHCNAATSSAYGTETYVMGLHRTERNLNVAKRENASVLLEDNYQANYDGFDPESSESHIIFSLYQNAYLDQSLKFAAKVEDQFKNRVGRKSRGVKQAGFLVLYKTTMPSVLIETGFLTNPTEGRYMVSNKGQDYLASGIFRAFRAFKKESEPTTNTASSVYQTSEQMTNEELDETTIETLHDENAIVFKIQVFASKKKKPKLDDRFLRFNEQLEIIRGEDGWNRYYIGSFATLNEAEAFKKSKIQPVFKQPFIVAYQKGNKYSLKELGLKN